MRYLYTFLIIFSSFYSFSQVGIGTTSPTRTLDINGDLRVRNTPTSSSTNDAPLVINGDGVIKKSISGTIGNFRGRLSTNYDSRLPENVANSFGIFPIDDGILQIIDPGDDFSIANQSFTAPVTGIYEVTITLTIKGYSTNNTNFVAGLIAEAGNWKMRFSMQKEEFDASGADIGASRTFTGVVTLFSGNTYKFGFAGADFVLLSDPSGASGTGVGSYFKINLLDNN